MKENLILVGISILLIVLMFSGFLMSRWVNYTFCYETKVEETIRALVKSECIKDKPHDQ